MKTSKHNELKAMNIDLEAFYRNQDLVADGNEPSMDTLMDSMHGNPLGRLLEVISLMPEVRTEKVIRAKRNIEQNDICSDTRMDVALDRILEEIVVED